MKDIIGLFLLQYKQEIIQANFRINYYDRQLREIMYINLFYWIRISHDITVHII